jgi:hypothetical protein
MWLEIFGKLKRNPMTQSGFEIATIHLAAQSLNQLRYSVKKKIRNVWK